jgi:uncharacterized membrane protein YedE/YeeE
MSETHLAIFGGILVGLGFALLLLTSGKLAGVSGISAGLLERKRGDLRWRIVFIAGLLSASLLWYFLWPDRFASSQVPSYLRMAVAGFLTGFGARLARGCTSGHGVCGLGRASPSSLTATAIFVVSGGLMVFLIRYFYAT